jgi:hypothetical protein
MVSMVLLSMALWARVPDNYLVPYMAAILVQ